MIVIEQLSRHLCEVRVYDRRLIVDCAYAREHAYAMLKVLTEVELERMQERPT